jgi:hypothetical protein
MGGKRMTVLLHKANEWLADIEALFASGRVAGMAVITVKEER